MKKFFLLFILVIILNPVSAMELEMKDSFKKGETLFAKISGSLVDSILPSNIIFYRGHVKVPFNFDITRINEDYYLYALLPETENNYTLSIEGVRYRQGSQITNISTQKNFSITSETADFYIDPGFVITKGDFSVKVQNLKNSKINININSEEEIELLSGQVKNIDFQVKPEVQPTVRTIKLLSDSQSYDLIVYILENKTAEDEKRKFIFSPKELEISLATNSNKSFPIFLENTGELDIENLSLSLSREIYQFAKLSTEEIKDFEKNSSIRIDLQVFSDTEINISGAVRAKTDFDLVYLPLKINFIRDFTPENNSNAIPTENSCLELGGSKCDSDEYCDGSLYGAVDGTCCVGQCKKAESEENGGSLTKIIGWSMLGILVLIVGWFFLKKYKGPRKTAGLEKFTRPKRSKSTL